MGHPYTAKFVLFDEAQLNIQPTASIETLKDSLYDLIFAEIEPYDDLNECSIELNWIASERLDTLMDLDWLGELERPKQDATWTSAIRKVLSDDTGLPEFVHDAYTRSGSIDEIKNWLQNNLETGASYRQGLSRAHEDTLMSLNGARFLGFDPDGYYYDTRAEYPCDARPEDFGDGQRIIVQMKVDWDC